MLWKSNLRWKVEIMVEMLDAAYTIPYGQGECKIDLSVTEWGDRQKKKK